MQKASTKDAENVHYFQRWNSSAPIKQRRIEFGLDEYQIWSSKYKNFISNQASGQLFEISWNWIRQINQCCYKNSKAILKNVSNPSILLNAQRLISVFIGLRIICNAVYDEFLMTFVAKMLYLLICIGK